MFFNQTTALFGLNTLFKDKVFFMFILIFLSVVLWANDLLQMALNLDFHMIAEVLKLISIEPTFLLTININKKDKWCINLTSYSLCSWSLKLICCVWNNRASDYERLSTIRISAMPFLWLQLPLTIRRDLQSKATVYLCFMFERKRVKKFYERSEFIVAFAFRLHKQDEPKLPHEARNELQ